MHLGNAREAAAVLMRLREVEPDMLIDEHVRRLINWNLPELSARAAEPAAILRRLWDETQGDHKPA
jgi:hypothetical protein